MKGRTLVIGIIIFVIIAVGAVYFLMMAEINKQKEEIQLEKSQSSEERVPGDLVYLAS